MLKKQFEELGAFETLRRVSDLGYHAVEISQIPMTAENVAEMRRARAELGMEIASLSAALEVPAGRPGESLTSGFDKIVDDCRALDSTMVRMGMLPFDAMASLDKVLDFCARSNEVAERLAEHGIGLYYHNHHIEFTRYDGRYLLDIIAERAPRLGLELDVHWIHRGGLDPVRVLQQYAGRVGLVHLKDYRIGQLPPEAFDSLARGDFDAFSKAFAGIVQFAEVGEGNLDFNTIIDTSLAIGVSYLLVEQDDQYGRDSLDCLATSQQNLVKLGYGDLF
nr:sugar phosphate isomerase/epimerase [Microlunatus panaciterrae]